MPDVFDFEIKIQDTESFDAVDLSGPFMPAQIGAWVFPREGIAGDRAVAVAVNGTIRAVSRTFQIPTGDIGFSAMVPESSFVAGSNRIRAFLVSGPPERPRLHALRNREKIAYTLKHEGSGEMIVSSRGDTISIVPRTVIGHVDIVARTPEYIFFLGWAAENPGRTPAKDVLVFSNGVAEHSAHTRMLRDDLVKALNSEHPRRAGFRIALPIAPSVGNMPEFRIFGVSDNGAASELKYRSGYPLTAGGEAVDVFKHGRP